MAKRDYSKVKVVINFSDTTEEERAEHKKGFLEVVNEACELRKQAELQEVNYGS